MSIFLKCEEANHTCDKNQYKEASFLEMIKLNIHVIFCKACREYSARNAKLTKFIKLNKVKTMSSQDKESLKQRLEKEIAKQ